METILFLGDSITYGYLVSSEYSFPKLIQKKFKQDSYEFNIINYGYPGDTIEMAYYRLKNLVNQKKRFLITVVFLGANDYFLEIPIQESYIDYKNIIQELKNISRFIFVVEFIPWDSKKKSDYKKMFIDLKKEYPEIIVIPDFFSEIVQNPELLLEDQIHPNEKGYQIIANRIYPYLKEVVQNQSKF